MPDIRYLCISDLHLGAANSLLTNLAPHSCFVDPSKPSPALEHLVACLRDLISRNTGGVKPTLILNGDLLEMALNTTNVAIMAFERFLELTMPENPDDRLFDSRIIFLPGNHDHHVWEMARETQYVNYLKTLSPPTKLPDAWHTTKMMMEHDPNPVPCYILDNVIQRYPHLADVHIEVVYPNLALISPDYQTCVAIHHGHFVESMYSLMSDLLTMIFPEHKAPTNIYDLESENFAWIDFFWSTLGRSGMVGSGVELVYDSMQAPQKFMKLLMNLDESAMTMLHVPGPFKWLSGKALEWTFEAHEKLEKKHPEQLLSPSSTKGLTTYISTYLRNQMLTELGPNLPSDITFIFGHTHKPFQDTRAFDGFGNEITVYNSGGWVVDTTEPNALHGGALILIDEALNVTSLRMYNETKDGSPCGVAVENGANRSNALYERMLSLVAELADTPTWQAFCESAAQTVRERHGTLTQRINSGVN